MDGARRASGKDSTRKRGRAAQRFTDQSWVRQRQLITGRYQVRRFGALEEELRAPERQAKATVTAVVRRTPVSTATIYYHPTRCALQWTSVHALQTRDARQPQLNGDSMAAGVEGSLLESRWLLSCSRFAGWDGDYDDSWTDSDQAWTGIIVQFVCTPRAGRRFRELLQVNADCRGSCRSFNNS